MNNKKLLIIILVSLLGLATLYGIFYYLISDEILSITTTKEITHLNGTIEKVPIAMNDSEFWKTISKWFFLSIAGILLLVGLIYLIYRLLTTDKKDPLEIPKQPVPTKTSKELFSQEYLKNEGIFHYYDYSDKKPKAIPCNKNDFKIMNEETFFDEKTGNQFQRMEVLSRGNRKGLATHYIETDKGEEHIPENYNFWVRENTPMQSIHTEKDFPVASIQDANQRLEAYKLGLMEEGYSPEELKKLEALKPQPQLATTTPKITSEESEVIELDKEKKRLENLESAEKITQMREERGA